LGDEPATRNRRILELLRTELGFGGVIVSDALDMAGVHGPHAQYGTVTPAMIGDAAVAAVAAGCDLLCLGTGGSAVQLDDIRDAVARAIDEGTLTEDRLADATARVSRLVDSLRGARTAPVSGPNGPDWDALVAAFDVAPGIVVAPDAVMVVVETTANIAVGHAPWGPPDGLDRAPVRRIVAGDPIPGDLAPDAPVVLVAKDVHRHPEVAALADVVRASRPGSLVVDMGWPSGPVDVATYGGSRGVGLALVHWLWDQGWGS